MTPRRDPSPRVRAWAMFFVLVVPACFAAACVGVAVGAVRWGFTAIF